MKKLILIMLLLASPALAEGYTGNELYNECSTTHKSYCFGYINGISYMSSLLNKNSCIPNGVTNGQVKAVVVKWLEDHPESRHKDAGATVLISLNEAWPCP